MKLNWFASYILVYLLTHSHWNLVVPVKAGEEDSASPANGTSGDFNSVEANNVSADAAEAEVSAEVGAPVSESSESKTHVSLYSSLAAKFKPFKTGADGNPVVMDRADYLEDFFSHNLTYAFKQDVACTLVRFGDKDVWKSGDHGVNEPKSVTIDGVTGELTVRDKEKAVHFRMDDNKVWKHVVTMSRERKPKVLKEADPTDANQAKSESAEASADPNQASSVPANEAEAGSTDANQAESGSTDTSEQSKDASADADASGGSGTAADADSSGGDGSTVTKEQDPSSASAE
nr:hypothetical protein MACL_00001213 [Theileria orientalis]